MYFAGHKVVQLRKKLKLTQQEFADKIGYSRTYLSDIELEKVSPSRRFIEVLSKFFGVSLSSLMTSGFNDWINYTVYTLTDTDELFFFYIYGFTDEELLIGEEAINCYLLDDDHVDIDAKGMKTAHELISAIMGKKIGNNKIYAQYARFCEEDERDWSYVFIKNLSLSKIQKKGSVLKRIIKLSVYQGIIVLDKPCFLEKNHEDLYAHAKITHASLDLL